MPLLSTHSPSPPTKSSLLQLTVTNIFGLVGILRATISRCIAWGISSAFTPSSSPNKFHNPDIRFVSAIHILKSDPSTLISGGGDPVLKIWDWMTGALKHELPVLEVIEPFIAVRASKRKRGSGFGDEDDEDAAEGSGNKGKGRRKKGKKGVPPPEEAVSEEAATPGAEGEEKKEEEPKLEKVLVIRRIESVETESGLHVVFSAVG
jgi:tRNA (guanine-N(7)-)-methyltransferase subunit TRM82